MAGLDTGDLHPIAPAVAGTRFADVRLVDRTGSTNGDLMSAAATGASEGLVLVADHQTAGRGRLGRRWEDAPGSSLLVSVLLRPDLPPNRLHLCTLAVAVATAEACDRVAGVRPGLKWPNDLVVADRKVAGVLAESLVSGGEVTAVVVGVGVNVRAGGVSPDVAPLAVSLEELAGRAPSRRDLLVALLRSLDRWWDQVAAGEDGRAALVETARAVSATVGQDVRVQRPASDLVGRAVDLDADGHLLVEDAVGDRHVIVAGDVVHLRTHGPGSP